jgi:hypothetical protein
MQEHMESGLSRKVALQPVRCRLSSDTHSEKQTKSTMKTDKFVYQWEKEAVRLRHCEGLLRRQIADRLGLRFPQVKYIFSKPNVIVVVVRRGKNYFGGYSRQRIRPAKSSQKSCSCQ